MAVRTIATFIPLEDGFEEFDDPTFGFVASDVGELSIEPNELVSQLGFRTFIPVRGIGPDLPLIAFDALVAGFEGVSLEEWALHSRIRPGGYRIEFVEGELRVVHLRFAPGSDDRAAIAALMEQPVVIEQSPPQAIGLAKLLSKADWVGAAALSGYGYWAGQLVIIVYAAGSLIILGAARGIAKGLERGLAKRIENAVSGNKKKGRK